MLKFMLKNFSSTQQVTMVNIPPNYKSSSSEDDVHIEPLDTASRAMQSANSW